MRFTYRAKDKEAQYCEGTVEADSREAAVERLAAQGLFPVTLDEQREDSRAIRPASPVRLGVWILLYDLFCVSAAGFAVFLGFGLGTAYKDRSLIDPLIFAAGLAATAACALLAIAGTGLLFNRQWARKLAFGGIIAGLVFGIASITAAGIAFDILSADFLFFLVACAINVIPGLVILFALRKPFLEKKVSLRAFFITLIVIIFVAVLVKIATGLIGTYISAKLHRESPPQPVAQRFAEKSPYRYTPPQPLIETPEPVPAPEAMPSPEVPEVQEPALTPQPELVPEVKEREEAPSPVPGEPSPEEVLKAKIGQLYKEAEALAEQRQFFEAETKYQELLALTQNAFGKDHPDVAATLAALGRLYEAWGKTSEAEEAYTKARESREQSQGFDHVDVAAVLNSLGALYYKSGRYVEAEDAFKRELDIEMLHLGDDDPDTIQTMINLGMVYEAMLQFAKAEELLLKALDRRERVFGREHEKTGAACLALGDLYYTVRKYDKAEPLFKRGLDIARMTQGAESEEWALVSARLGQVYFFEQKFAQAQPYFEKAVEVLDKARGQDTTEFLLLRQRLAEIAYARGNIAKAEGMWLEILLIAQRVCQPGDEELSIALRHVAGFYRHINNPQEAEKYERMSRGNEQRSKR